MVNPEGEIAFARFTDGPTITTIRIVPGPCAIAHLEDGTEEMFTDEVHESILSAMTGKPDILVAHIGEDGKTFREYTIPLVLSL